MIKSLIVCDDTIVEHFAVSHLKNDISSLTEKQHLLEIKYNRFNNIVFIHFMRRRFINLLYTFIATQMRFTAEIDFGR